MSSGRIMAVAMAGFLAASLAAGCGKPYRIVPKEQLNLVKTNYGAVDRMLWSSRSWVGRGTPILVATFVNLDDVTQTSPLGRVIGELCAARLTQKGYRVINAKVRPDSIVIKPSGEFLLSRDVTVLSKEYGADVVLVGAYTRTDVRDKLRSLNQKLESADPELMAHPRYANAPRIFETINDSLYVSLRLVNAKNHTVLAAYDYVVPLDEGVESLLIHGEDEGYSRY